MDVSLKYYYMGAGLTPPRAQSTPTPAYTGAKISVKLFLKTYIKISKYILINLKIKGKYLKIVKLNLIISFFDAPKPLKRGRAH